jgi:iron complex outermembrane receptor protein
LPANNYRWYENTSVKNDANVYAKWQQDLTQNLQVFTDLQVRRVSYSISGFRENPGLAADKQYTFFNPKAGLTYHNKSLDCFCFL